MIELKLSQLEVEALAVLVKKELLKIEGALTESAAIKRIDLQGILDKVYAANFVPEYIPELVIPSEGDTLGED